MMSRRQNQGRRAGSQSKKRGKAKRRGGRDGAYLDGFDMDDIDTADWMAQCVIHQDYKRLERDDFDDSVLEPVFEKVSTDKKGKN